MKFQFDRDTQHTGEFEVHTDPNEANPEPEQAARYLDFSETAEGNSAGRKPTVFERLEKQKCSSVRDSAASRASAGASPRIQEGLIKKLETSREKSRLGEFKVAAKIHKRKGNGEGPTPMKAKITGGSSSSDRQLSSQAAKSGDKLALSRENSAESQPKQLRSRAAASDSVNVEDSASRRQREEDAAQIQCNERKRHLSSGSSDRNSAAETLTDADTGEDPLSSGLRRRSVRTETTRRMESGSETDEHSPASTRENVISVKERSPSPGTTGLVRRGSRRKRRTASGGSEENEAIRDILPDKHDLMTGRRRVSGSGDVLNSSPNALRSASDGAVEKAKQQKSQARRTASDSNLENRSYPVLVRGTGSDLTDTQSDARTLEKSKIPVKAKDRSEEPTEPLCSLSRSNRGRHSERVKTAKREVVDNKRSSSVGATRGRESHAGVVVEKPPLAKPVVRAGDKSSGRDGGKSSRSSSKEELRNRLVPRYILHSLIFELLKSWISWN